MKKSYKHFLSILFFTCSMFSISAQEVLKPKIAQLLKQNVFEVVVEKIQEDPLSYEKELPLDRIPYQIRMDKYDSIGTAFLLKDGNFYTAAHVLNLYKESQLNKFFIRDTEGKTYKINNIVRFASDRDFVIFDVVDFNNKNAKGLEIDEKYKINSTIFAVGNAQGEGIVMRNGLLTSETPENRNGKWNWLRFSAAASPGNSGGPLVTPQGKVIGIVAMKNSSENLNYALPITQIKQVPQNKGELHIEAYYNLPNILTQRFYHTIDFELDLPKPIEEVQKICIQYVHENTEKLTKEITLPYKYFGKENFTLNDLGNPLLNSKYEPNFPYLLCLSEKSKWGTYYPENISSLKLENNGTIEVGSMLGVIFSYLRKPDDVSVQEYIEKPKLLMDTLSKAFVMNRYVGSEKIMITSYGEPIYKSTHTDTLGRQWIITAYNVPFADYVVYNYSLPLPDGVFSLTAMMQTDTIWSGICFDFKFLSDFILTSYTATYKQWAEYFTIPEEVYPRHSVLKDAFISSDEQSTDINFNSLKITCPQNIFPTNDKTDFSLNVGLRPTNENTLKLEIQTITANTLQTSNDNVIFIYSRDYKPHQDASKDIRDAYEKIVSQTIPYNAKPYEQEQKTAIFIPTITDDHVDIVGLIYKGSKMDIIEENAKTLQESTK